MTKDEIMKMALEAGLGDVFGSWCQECGCNDEMLLRFAELVVDLATSEEREACADILDRNADRCDPYSIAFDVLDSNAKAIRARGQQ